MLVRSLAASNPDVPRSFARFASVIATSRFLRGFIFYRQAYDQAAHSFLQLIDEEMDVIYSDLRLLLERRVYCIHLDVKNAFV